MAGMEHISSDRSNALNTAIFLISEDGSLIDIGGPFFLRFKFLQFLNHNILWKIYPSEAKPRVVLSRRPKGAGKSLQILFLRRCLRVKKLLTIDPGLHESATKLPNGS